MRLLGRYLEIVLKSDKNFIVINFPREIITLHIFTPGNNEI